MKYGLSFDVDRWGLRETLTSMASRIVEGADGGRGRTADRTRARVPRGQRREQIRHWPVECAPHGRLPDIARHGEQGAVSMNTAHPALRLPATTLTRSPRTARNTQITCCRRQPLVPWAYGELPNEIRGVFGGCTGSTPSHERALTGVSAGQGPLAVAGQDLNR